MGNHNIESQLNLIIKLLEELPKKLAIELEKMDRSRFNELRNKLTRQYESNIPIKIHSDDPKDKEREKEIGVFYKFGTSGKIVNSDHMKMTYEDK